MTSHGKHEPDRPPHSRRGLRRLWFAWIHRPYTLLAAVILTIAGGTAVILGDTVSAALAVIAVGYVSRTMGAAMFLGGILTLYGIWRGRSVLEVLGLALLTVGCGLYSVGVFLGLGVHGVIAGSGFLILSLGSARRLVTLAARDPLSGADD